MSVTNHLDPHPHPTIRSDIGQHSRFLRWLQNKVIIPLLPPFDSKLKRDNLSENKTKGLRNDLSLLISPRHIFGKFNPNPGDDSTFALIVESSPDPRTG